MTNFRVVASLWALTGAIALAGASAHAVGWRINHTPSLPMGLRRIASIERAIARGDIVAFCPPDSEPFREARRRGYLGGGECPGDYEPLLKPVVAIAGDRVEIGPHGIAVNGVLLANSLALAQDRHGCVIYRPSHALKTTEQKSTGRKDAAYPTVIVGLPWPQSHCAFHSLEVFSPSTPSPRLAQ
jgi:conjugative transfer signal peptidase TraF